MMSLIVTSFVLSFPTECFGWDLELNYVSSSELSYLFLYIFDTIRIRTSYKSTDDQVLSDMLFNENNERSVISLLHLRLNKIHCLRNEIHFSEVYRCVNYIGLRAK